MFLLMGPKSGSPCINNRDSERLTVRKPGCGMPPDIEAHIYCDRYHLTRVFRAGEPRPEGGGAVTAKIDLHG